MAIEDRFDRSGTVKSLTETLNDAGGVSDVEADLVTSYRFFVYPMSQKDMQYVRSSFGFEPDGKELMIAGEANTNVAKNLIIVDTSSSERFKVLGVHKQDRNQGITHHLSMVVRKMGLTASES